MERWNGRIALVTGASAGMGAEFCRVLVKHGMKVVGVARNPERIEKIADELKSEKGKLYAVKCDLQKEEDILAVFEYIKKNFGKLHVCINNAGFSKDQKITEGNFSDWKAMFEVNVLAALLCCKESINLMKANNIDDGHIINISSTAGQILHPAPVAIYTATKHSLEVVTEFIRRELRESKSHTRISIISPGMTETEFFHRAYSHLPADKVQDMFFNQFKTLEAKDIADALIYVLSAPPHVQVHDVLLRPTEQVG